MRGDRRSTSVTLPPPPILLAASLGTTAMNNDVFAARLIYVRIYIQMDYSLAGRHLAHLNMNAEGHFLTSRSVLEEGYGSEKRKNKMSKYW